MTEDEFGDLMRKALTDDSYWSALVAGDEREQAVDWLRDALSEVRKERKARKAAWSAESWGHRKGSPSWRAAHTKYHDWLARSYGFEKLAIRRVRELGLNEQGYNESAFKIRARKVEVASAHADTMRDENKRLVQALATLTDAAVRFVDGDATVRELADLLNDQTVLLRASGESVSLRHFLTSRNEAQERRAARATESEVAS